MRMMQKCQAKHNCASPLDELHGLLIYQLQKLLPPFHERGGQEQHEILNEKCQKSCCRFEASEHTDTQKQKQK